MRKLLMFLCCLLAPARAQTGTEVKTLEFGGLKRQYRLHLPATRPEHPALVVVLHGGGGTARQMERFCGFSQLADQQGFVVLYPDGYDKGWNDLREGGFNTAHQRNLDDVGFITAAVERTLQEHQIDPNRIYATGISNGGFMCARLALEASDRFAAIAPVAAGLPIATKPDPGLPRPVSVMIVQGTQDPLVPYTGGQVTAFNSKRGQILSSDETVQCWCRANQCQSKGQTQAIPDQDPNDGCQVYRTRYNGKAAVEFWKITGGGHTWPGASQYLPVRLVGKVCNDFQATQAIWTFFQLHPRPPGYSRQ